MEWNYFEICTSITDVLKFFSVDYSSSNEAFKTGLLFFLINVVIQDDFDYQESFSEHSSEFLWVKRVDEKYEK